MGQTFSLGRISGIQIGVNGLKVEGITLWLLGGVSQFQGEVPDPGERRNASPALGRW